MSSISAEVDKSHGWFLHLETCTQRMLPLLVSVELQGFAKQASFNLFNVLH